jgi:4-amino-4-deoxychorismate lyase
VESALRKGGRQPGLKLIETMHWDGTAIPRLPRHLARLWQGAATLGWHPPKALVGLVLHHTRPIGPARLRLTLDRQGHPAVEVLPLPAPKPLWYVGIATSGLRSDDPWLRVKSTNRAVYDEARAALPEGLDEVIFRNERGEVCDGSITTVFFDRGQGMRTPPLTSGLLPGVLRAELACPEEVLRADELPHVRLWVGNALRGLIPAVWVGSSSH